MHRVTFWIGILANVTLAWACGGNIEEKGAVGAAGIDGAGGSGAVGGSGATGGSGAAAGTGAVAGSGNSAGSGVGGSGGSGGGACPVAMPDGNSECHSEGQICKYQNSGCPAPNDTSSCACSSSQWMCTVPECPTKVVACREQPPAIGSRCTEDPKECWYRTDPRPYCRSRFICTLGTWADYGQGDCASPSNVCPADPKQPPDGVCGANESRYCTYGPEYACDCVYGGRGGGMNWECMTPPGGQCPDAASNAGAQCSGPTSTPCQYGFSCSAIIMECTPHFSPPSSYHNVWEMTGQSACAQ
jgi:hypothetical protein